MSRKLRGKSAAEPDPTVATSTGGLFGASEADVAALMAAGAALTDGLERIGRECSPVNP